MIFAFQAEVEDKNDEIGVLLVDGDDKDAGGKEEVKADKGDRGVMELELDEPLV